MSPHDAGDILFPIIEMVNRMDAHLLGWLQELADDVAEEMRLDCELAHHAGYCLGQCTNHTRSTFPSILELP